MFPRDLIQAHRFNSNDGARAADYSAHGDLLWTAGGTATLSPPGPGQPQVAARGAETIAPQAPKPRLAMPLERSDTPTKDTSYVPLRDGSNLTDSSSFEKLEERPIRAYPPRMDEFVRSVRRRLCRCAELDEFYPSSRGTTRRPAEVVP
jgi:hypothetical protein